jgi:hypothetical protein
VLFFFIFFNVCNKNNKLLKFCNQTLKQQVHRTSVRLQINLGTALQDIDPQKSLNEFIDS